MREYQLAEVGRPLCHHRIGNRTVRQPDAFVVMITLQIAEISCLVPQDSSVRGSVVL